LTGCLCISVFLSQIAKSGELRVAGPDFVLGGGHSFPEELYAYGGLALLEGSDGGASVGVATAVAAANCTAASVEASANIYTT
jgi:hypothetical protein